MAKAGGNHKMKVLSLVDRTTGRAKSTVLDFISAKAIGEIVVANLSHEAILMTDEARHYTKLGQQFEYVSRFNPQVHTNTVEGFFSIFKRGMRGVYQHASKRYLHRYLAEFDLRYSNRIAPGVGDVARADTVLRGYRGQASHLSNVWWASVTMKKPKKAADEDEGQSQRFIQAAKDLEAAGELNLTEAAESFDKISDSILRPVRGGPAANGVREPPVKRK